MERDNAGQRFFETDDNLCSMPGSEMCFFTSGYRRRIHMKKRNYFVMPLMFLFFTMGWEDKKVVSFVWGGPKSGAVEY
jgi:hypothetical protein